MNPVDTVLAFLDAINQHAVEKMAGLMTADHVFIDFLGNSVRGREKMRAGWVAYFAMCPDYRVSHEEVFPNGNTVAVFGSAGGTIRARGEPRPDNQWQTPAAWRAVVHNGLIQEWRVYADNKPVYDILAKSAKPAAAK
jgi:uncharacterized protein (TIGR02246 family)